MSHLQLCIAFRIQRLVRGTLKLLFTDNIKHGKIKIFVLLEFLIREKRLTETTQVQRPKSNFTVETEMKAKIQFNSIQFNSI
jgi:hypothetical protein